MSPITVAIIGATGNLGVPLTKTFLSKEYYPDKVHRVIFLTRDSSSAKAKELIALGAEAVQASGDSVTAEQLKGVDVLVNTTTTGIPAEVTNAYATAAAEAGVKVYFPAKYGNDTSLSTIKHKFFDHNDAQVEFARKAGGGRLKVIAVNNGAFLEYLFSPFLGLDIATNTYTTWGDPNVKLATTAIKDIAHAIAQLSVLAANDPTSVPDHVRIQGDAKSYHEIADIVTRETGKPSNIVVGDYEAKKKELDDKYHGEDGAFEYLRLMFAEGVVNFTDNNHNETINPKESIWKWTTIADQVKATVGKQ